MNNNSDEKRRELAREELRKETKLQRARQIRIRIFLLVFAADQQLNRARADTRLMLFDACQRRNHRHHLWQQ